jgi:tripartite-type tricarboxylate transporter receptor subunit TctC
MDPMMIAIWLTKKATGAAIRTPTDECPAGASPRSVSTSHRRRFALLAAIAARATCLAGALCGVGGVVGVVGVAHADAISSYPDKPIRLVIPYGVGGVSDSVGRVLATGLGKALGQPVIVDNRGGGGGTIGGDIVARADPDGYTIVLTSPPMIAVAPVMMGHLSYDPSRSFTPIGPFISTPNILVVNNNLPVHNLKELVAYAKGPGKGNLSFAHAGPGSTGQLSGQILMTTSGISMAGVPYRSSGMAFPDLISGRVQLLFDSVPSTISFVRSGQVRPIVVMSKERSSVLPDVPTAAEEGYPAATMAFWEGIEGPAGMPPAIVDKLNAGLRTAINEPGVIEALKNLGADPYLLSPQEFSKMRMDEIIFYQKLITSMGLSANK